MTQGKVGRLVLLRMGVCAAVGLVTVLFALRPATEYAPLMGWVVGAGTYLIWTWLVLGRMTPAQTRDNVNSEDPSHRVGEMILLMASMASLAGIVTMIGSAQGGGAQVAPAALGLGAIGLSWGLVQTVFTTKYARLYYTNDAGGVDFNGGDDYAPDYVDFAYLAFTLGMTYQVSDTDLQSREARRTAVKHALLSYLLGAVVLAMTINLVVQLAAK